MYKALDSEVPAGYRFKYKHHPVKYIERPIPGVYDKNADNPTHDGPILHEYGVSDSSGRITFADMRLSQAGPIGKYTVMFNCGRYSVKSIHDIEVTTSIGQDRLRFVQKFPKQVFVTDQRTADNDMVVSIEALDQNDNGVVGKYPQNVFITTNNTEDQDNVMVALAHDSDSFSASKKDGVMNIPIKITKINQETVANLTFQVDGINITTSYIKFTLDSEFNSTLISRIEITEYPSERFEEGIALEEQFRLKFKVYNTKGEPLDPTNNQFTVQKISDIDGQAPYRTSFFDMY